MNPSTPQTEKVYGDAYGANETGLVEEAGPPMRWINETAGAVLRGATGTVSALQDAWQRGYDTARLESANTIESLRAENKELEALVDDLDQQIADAGG